ncbi:MAG: hypothetical protein QXP34_02380 [Candidatus Aenigmatarchaeota archaeon]
MEAKKNLLLLLMLVAFPIALSQSFNEIIQTIIAIAIILAIVVVLMYLGGVLPKKRISGIPLGIILYSLLIIIVFVIPVLQRVGIIKIFPDTIDEAFQANPAFAESYQKSFMLQKLPSPVCSVFKYLAVDERIACYMPAFLYFFLLPFAALFAITWAFLKQLNIFEGVGRDISALLAFIIAFMTLPMGVFIIMVSIWFSFLGAFSIAIFVVMFLAGLFFRGYGYVGKEYYYAKARIRAIKRTAEGLIAELEEFKLKMGGKTVGQLKSELDDIVNKYPTFKPQIDDIKNNVIGRWGKGDQDKPDTNQLQQLEGAIDNLIKGLQRI